MTVTDTSPAATASALPAPPEFWPAILQTPPWRDAQAVPPMPSLPWALALSPLRWQWEQARKQYNAASSHFSYSLGYMDDKQWAFVQAPPTEATRPDWQARAQRVLHEGYDKNRIAQSMHALSSERGFPDDWTRWPAQHQLLLACGVPAHRVAEVAQKPTAEAADFCETRCAYHWGFDSALPTHLVLGYWEAFGGAGAKFAEMLERLWLADEAQVHALLQTHRLPQSRDRLILAMAVAWPALAPWVASCLGGVKWRDQLAQSWLGGHPAKAAQGLWPEALNPEAARQDAAWAALRWLHMNGHAEAVQTAFEAGLQAAHAQNATERPTKHPIDTAWQAALARLAMPPEYHLPSPLPKLTKALAQTFTEATPLVLKASGPKGEALTLPPEAMQDALMAAMLCKPDAPYVGFEQVQAACTRESLAQWGRSLYDLWQAEGMPAKARFILPLQGWVGDDATATKLHKGILQWRAKLDRVRAYDGITALSRMGGNGALTWLAALAEHKRYDDLRGRAKRALARAAEQRGMGLDDLADVTLPDLGFDAQSRQWLDFGPRRFELLLTEQLELRLREQVDPATPADRVDEAAPAKPRKAAKKPASAWLKTLPKPRVSDDAELAAQAKRQLKDVQAQLKALGRRQLERMEAAMCNERRWPVAHFRDHLVAHPLARVLVQRLVFGVYAPPIAKNDASGLDTALSTPICLFRVAEDGLPTDAQDQALSWGDLADWAAAAAPGAQAVAEPEESESAAQPACIGIVHPLALAAMPDGEALRQAFASLLADYELLQPFEQLARETHGMASEVLASSQVDAWSGKQLSAGSLMGLMAQGWQREVGDGGMIYTLSHAVKGSSGTPLQVHVSFEPGWFVGESVNTQAGQTMGPFVLSGQVQDAQTPQSPEPSAPRPARWHDLSPIARSELLRTLHRLAWWQTA